MFDLQQSIKSVMDLTVIEDYAGTNHFWPCQQWSNTSADLEQLQGLFSFSPMASV